MTGPMRYLALLQRELQSYYLSPLAYLVLAAFLFFSGYSASYILDIYNTNRLDISMRDIFYNLEFLAMFVVPLISMRLLAEERKSGTLEMLMTAPVTDLEVVLAKFTGSLLFWITLLVPTLIYYWVLVQHANIEHGSVITGYLGLVLLGALFLSIGTFVSAISKDQIVASLVTFVVLFILYTISGFAEAVDSKALGISWRDVIGYVGFMAHYDSFRKGVIDSRDVIYYVSVSAVFLFLAVRSLESRRWA